MIIHLQVKPGSGIDSITFGTDGTMVIKIKAPPVDGKANKYLVAYLSEVFKIPKSKIAITKGETSKHKTITIDADETYLRKVLEALRVC
jgi:uncharacterized protein